MDARTSRYHDVYARWQRDPEGFWGEAAKEIDWYEPPKKVFDKDAGIYGRWFTGGVTNTCYNALDRHIATRNDQAALIYNSPVTNTKQTFTYGRMLSEVQLLGAMLRDFGVKKGDVVILYMPMVPEAVFAMLACARIGAIHSVVFGGFAPKELATRINDCKPKVILSASCGIEVNRVVPYKPLLDEAIKLAQHKPRRVSHPAAPAMRGDAGRGPRPRLAQDVGARGQLRQDQRMRAGRRHRSALHPLHLGHDRHPKRRGARQWRPHGRAEMVDAISLRRQSGRDLVVRLRHRLGGRPLLHRLCAAVPRRHLDHVRGQAGRHARRRRLLARHRRAQGGGAVHRADRVPRHPQGGPGRQAAQAIRSVEIPHAVLGRRARRPADHPLGGRHAEKAGDRPLVADRNRLVHRRQSGRPRRAAGEIRLGLRADAGLPDRRRRRGLPSGAGEQDRLHRRQAAAAAGQLPDAVAAGRPLQGQLPRPNSPATTRPPTPATRTRTATSSS